MTHTDDWGTATHDWLTVIDQDNWIMFISDGSTITIARTDFGVEVHHVNPSTGETSEFEGTPFPYRAGAMETVRKWLASNNLTSVPSPEQAAQPWHGWSKRAGNAAAIKYDHSYRAKYDAARVTPAPVAVPTPPADFDPLAFAASLSLARDILDAAPVPETDRHIMPGSEPFDAEAFAAQLAAKLQGKP